MTVFWRGVPTVSVTRSLNDLFLRGRRAVAVTERCSWSKKPASQNKNRLLLGISRRALIVALVRSSIARKTFRARRWGFYTGLLELPIKLGQVLRFPTADRIHVNNGNDINVYFLSTFPLTRCAIT